MPPIPAAHLMMVLRAVIALVALGATVMTGVTVYSSPGTYIHGLTWIPLPTFEQIRASQFGLDSSSEACPNCLHVHSDDKPTPTLPLSISYASSFVLRHTPTPTPSPKPRNTATVSYFFLKLRPFVLRHTPIPTPPPKPMNTATASSPFLTLRTPSQGGSTLATWSIWCQNLLRYTHVITTLPLKEQQSPSVTWVIIFVSSCSISLACAAVYSLPRLNSDRRHPNGEEIFVHKPNRRTKRLQAKKMARINRMANQKLKSLRNLHAHKLNKTYERPVPATANIEPNFGPSIWNAEVDFWNRLETVEMTEGKRADVIAFFRMVLYSFSHALAVEESRPEGSNTRYFSVIEEQERLIHALRLLHQSREQAFADLEDLVRIISKAEERPSHRWSMEFDKFIIQPVDGPAALSMEVSVSAAPFDRRPITILDSDPHWQRFLESATARRPEEVARVTSYEATSIPRCPNLSSSPPPPPPLQDQNPYYEGEVDKESRSPSNLSKKTGEAEATKGPSSLPKKTGDTEVTNEALEDAENYLKWLQWKLACLKGGHDQPPEPTTKVTDDTEMARRYQEEEWAACPILAIGDCEGRIAMLEVDIACLKRESGIPTTAGDHTISQPPAEPEPKPKPTQKRKWQVSDDSGNAPEDMMTMMTNEWNSARLRRGA